jgi:hypothetical protein
MAGYERLWQAMAPNDSLWQAMAGLGDLWQAVVGYGRLLQVYGMLCQISSKTTPTRISLE